MKLHIPIGTKSVLYGAHCFLLHPLFVAIAWIRLFGFPFDPRIWLAFFVHDLGYWGKPNMDGPEGETHVELGAKIMHIFDGWQRIEETEIYPTKYDIERRRNEGWIAISQSPISIHYRRWVRKTYWRDFSMYHSRYYAKKNNAKPSKLCFADKLSFCTTPRWLYLPMVTATGEINEYLKMAQLSETQHWKPVQGKIKWHNQLRRYMLRWTAEHVDGKEDKWTSNNRHQK